MLPIESVVVPTKFEEKQNGQNSEKENKFQLGKHYEAWNFMNEKTWRIWVLLINELFSLFSGNPIVCSAINNLTITFATAETQCLTLLHLPSIAYTCLQDPSLWSFSLQS